MTKHVRHPTLLLVAFVAACADAGARAPAIATRDSAGIAIVENDLARLTATCAVSPQPVVSIGSAEGDENYELYRVFGASRLSDGRIVLVNQGSQQLRYYDATGVFEKSAGGAGQGPGEFQNAFYLWVLPGDTIWVGDYRPWQFHVYGPDGAWLRTVRPRPEYGNPPSSLQVLADGRAILGERPFTSAGPNFGERLLTVVQHAPDGTLLDTIGQFPDGRWGRLDDDPMSMGLYPLFESFSRVDAQDMTLAIGHMSEAGFGLFRTQPDIALERLVRWTAGSREVTPEDLAAERSRIADQYADMDPGMRRRMVDPLISDQRPVAEVMPAYRSLMIARDGRIWIREYDRPTQAEAQHWMVFDAAGRFACRATLPDVRQVLEFGDDYFLALDQDELGVERVLEFSLSAPSAGS